MSWTGCYNDECLIHLSDKECSGWFPRKPRGNKKRKSTPWPLSREVISPPENEPPKTDVMPTHVTMVSVENRKVPAIIEADEGHNIMTSQLAWELGVTYDKGTQTRKVKTEWKSGLSTNQTFEVRQSVSQYIVMKSDWKTIEDIYDERPQGTMKEPRQMRYEPQTIAAVALL